MSMTENEALEMIKSMTIHPNCEMLKAFDFQSIVIKALEDLEQYRAIGTVEEFQTLKEKAEPKKPIELDQWGEYWKCSTCGKYAVDNLGCRYKFCPNCGTKFDWQ